MAEIVAYFTFLTEFPCSISSKPSISNAYFPTLIMSLLNILSTVGGGVGAGSLALEAVVA